jgi:hypothetical protein
MTKHAAPSGFMEVLWISLIPAVPPAEQTKTSLLLPPSDTHGNSSSTASRSRNGEKDFGVMLSDSIADDISVANSSKRIFDVDQSPDAVLESASR